jgi:hypothetical protein
MEPGAEAEGGLSDLVNRGGMALTVAGQWRTFTAFPSILTIVVVKCAASI